MLTNTGKFLRKLRIDNNELLKDMADKLGVTSSFLSSVENGKKRMPSSWNIKICELYDLSKEQKSEFTSAIAETENNLELNLISAPQKNRELAVIFARALPGLDNEQISEIQKIIRRNADKKNL